MYKRSWDLQRKTTGDRIAIVTKYGLKFLIDNLQLTRNDKLTRVTDPHRPRTNTKEKSRHFFDSVLFLLAYGSAVALSFTRMNLRNIEFSILSSAISFQALSYTFNERFSHLTTYDYSVITHLHRVEKSLKCWFLLKL